MKKDIATNPFNIVVIVAALGYFVDIYDLVLFLMVKDASLLGIGIPAAELKGAGVDLMNLQMIGMLLGGIVWGILGDKRGRLSTLFLTILLYSLANIANGFVTSFEQYAVLRFIAGFGLAGELGIGITLVSEVMSKEKRAWGTGIVAGVGIAGAVLAWAVAKWGWREAYWIGGALGLGLLALRVYVHESGMFDKVKSSGVERGNFFSLFTDRRRVIKYIACILIGMPVWFTAGILMGVTPAFGVALELTGPVTTADAVMYHYTGAAFGSILTSWLSEKLHSRKKALWIAIGALAVCCGWYFMLKGSTPTTYYIVSFALGICMGYWAVFVTVASEQFGTNIRSTVTTTVPNFVRGTLAIMSIWWLYMSDDMSMGAIKSAIIVGAVVFAIALISVFFLEESHGKDLDYTEKA